MKIHRCPACGGRMARFFGMRPEDRCLVPMRDGKGNELKVSDVVIFWSGSTPELPMRKYVTITKADVGRRFFKAFGQTWSCSSFIGRILPKDIGKRVYLVGGILQVENDEQRAKRNG